MQMDADVCRWMQMYAEDNRREGEEGRDYRDREVMLSARDPGLTGERSWGILAASVAGRENWRFWELPGSGGNSGRNKLRQEATCTNNGVKASSEVLL